MSVQDLHAVFDDEGDIYRGEPPSPNPQAQAPQEPAPSISSGSSSSSSSSDSSFSLNLGLRLGLAAKVEHAISRWARNMRRNSSSTGSSSSSSSSSSSASKSSFTRSQAARRRRRRPSVSSLHTLQSERDIAARITRKKALQESRLIPRQFVLYLPPSAPVPQVEEDTPQDRRVTTTKDVNIILQQLELALRKPGRQRRARQRQRADVLREDIPRDFWPAGAPHPPLRKGRKGKHRQHTTLQHLPILEEVQAKPQAWFLDIANPTWTDLRAIGKLLHLHPLTLEDILQQESREKLEIFSKLGYYFISFRAIESRVTREKIQAGLPESSGKGSGLEQDGSIGEANVYLAVFNDGICCFHFTDVAEHIERVRNRTFLLKGIANTSADWMAHGILDSIVDSFFPFAEEIEREVVEIDDLVFSAGITITATTTHPSKAAPPEIILSKPLPIDSEKSSPSETTAVDEKYTPAQKVKISYLPPNKTKSTKFIAPRPTIPLVIRRAKRRVVAAWKRYWAKPEPTPSATQLTLRRMARTRKLVTVLGRLLSSKSDIITQIKKRLMKTAGSGMHMGQIQADELEIAIYMGDIQDHILTLQQSLAHYERMLSQSHPIYLAQLRSEFEATKGGNDMQLMYLSTVSIATVCVQTLTGLFSLNILIPTNSHEPSGRYNVFGIIVASSCAILVITVGVVRYWWKMAQRRPSSPL